MAYRLQVHCNSIYQTTGHHNGKPTNISDFEPEEEKVPVANPAQFFRDYGRDYFVCCADFEAKALVLVKPKEKCTLNRAPFFREVLRRNAEELLVILFSQLADVAAAVAGDVAQLTTIFLYHTTRCGSTLLVKALEASGAVHTVSEPDVYISISQHVIRKEHIDGDEMETILDVIRHTQTLFNYTLFQEDPQKTATCYKLRGQDCVIADLLTRALPEVKNVFLYRDLVGTVDSYAHIMAEGRYWKYWLLTTLRLDSILVSNGVGVSPTPPWEHPVFASIPVPHGILWFYACLWLVIMQKALSLTKESAHNGFHVVLRYKELSTYKEKMVLKVMDILGIEYDSKFVEGKIREVFGVNSQMGHKLASIRPTEENSWMGDWERDIIFTILDHVGMGIDRPDFVLNGTVTQI